MAIQTDSATIREQRAAFYRENGYLVVEDALSADEVAAINAETLAICRGERGDIAGAAPDIKDGSDAEVLARYLCLHHAHKVSPLLLDVMSHPVAVDVLTSVIGPNVKAVQSMLFIKAAGKPGQAWHQDENFLATRDRSLTGFWIALDDATTENGCLWVIPGSHERGILWQTRQTDDEDFDCADEAIGFPYSKDDEIPVEVTAGSVVLFHGYLLHRSLPNRAATGFRRALVNHYMSAESLYPNGFEFGFARADNRDIVMIAGEDPYAWKGTDPYIPAHLRPERMGGCRWFNEDELEAHEDGDGNPGA